MISMAIGCILIIGAFALSFTIGAFALSFTELVAWVAFGIGLVGVLVFFVGFAMMRRSKKGK